MNASLKCISSTFDDSVETIRKAHGILATRIEYAAELMIQCLTSGGKILACGNGGSAADAQHFSGEMLNRFMRERPPSMLRCVMSYSYATHGHPDTEQPIRRLPNLFHCKVPR